MARQLTDYLTGPGRDRAHWTRRTGADEAPYWTTGALDRRWGAVHIPDPARHPTADPDIVDPGFLSALGQAVATVAAAEQRPTSAVITDILTTGRRTRTTRTAAPTPGAALVDQWHAHTPRARAPRMIVQPAREQWLDAAIGKVFARAYRQAWRHQMHTLLVAEGTAALARLAKHGDPPPPPLPVDRDQFHYKLEDGYLLDWHLFRRLRARGQARGPGGAADLQAALELVRGMPLAEFERIASTTRSPYNWLPTSDIDPDHLAAAIVDTATELAELYLAAGDTIGARWAIDKAWLVDPDRNHDQPWHILLRVHAHDGHLAELEACVHELMRLREAEVEEDLDPAIYALLQDVLPSGYWERTREPAYQD